MVGESGGQIRSLSLDASVEEKGRTKLLHLRPCGRDVSIRQSRVVNQEQIDVLQTELRENGESVEVVRGKREANSRIRATRAPIDEVPFRRAQTTWW